MAKLEQQLGEMLSPAVEALGFELLGVELMRAGRHTTVRIYIDAEAGITVDNCAEVSRQVSAVMDVEDPISHEYTLEVSSPGADRPLFKPAHFSKAIGEVVSVRTALPIEGRRKFKGVLQAADAVSITIELDDVEADAVIAFDNIDKANVVAQF